MQCPACGGNLSPVQADAVTVDVCREGCGGMWLDQLELKRLENAPAAQTLLDLEITPSVSPDLTARRHCPKCPDVMMMQSFYSPRRKVRVDQCPNCGGHWLDGGELGEIRSLYESPEERQAQVDSLIADAFGDDLEAMSFERAEAASRYSPFRRLFRLLTG